MTAAFRGRGTPVGTEDVDERRRRRRPITACVDRDVPDQARRESQRRALDPGHDDVVGNQGQPEPRRGQPDRPLGLRGSHRASRLEPCAPADLLDDARQPVVRVVQHPFALAQLLQPRRCASLRVGRIGRRRSRIPPTRPSPAVRPSGAPVAGRSRSRRRLARPHPRAGCDGGTRAGGSTRSDGARATRRCGAAARRRPSRAPSRSRARRARAARAERAPCQPRSSARTAVRASGSKLRPAGVSETPRGSRSRIAPSSSVSSALMCCESDGCVMPDSARGARERAFVDDRHEALELAKVHRQNLSHLVPRCGLDLSPGSGEDRDVRATGINHVSISASDLEESTRFYEEVFGMERIPTPIFETPVQWLRVGDLQLHLFLDDAGTAPARHHLGLTIDDFEAAYEVVRERASRRVGRTARRAPVRSGAALLPRSGGEPDRAQLARRRRRSTGRCIRS